MPSTIMNPLDSRKYRHAAATGSHRLYCGALLAILVVLCAGLSSCTKPKTSQPLATKRYPFTGRVISIDRQANSALIDGDMIQGYMEAMAMSYTLKPVTQLTQLSPGDSISAEIVVIDEERNQNQNKDASPDYWLEKVKVTQHAKVPAEHAALSQNATVPQHIPAPGEDVPDFKFTNQGGKHFSLAQYRGHLLFLTFIYTRCPFPDYCPRVSDNFLQIYKQMASDAALAVQARLLSVSFDPVHDTPSVLRDYGFSLLHAKQSKLFDRWQFAVPSANDLPRIADFFSLTYKTEQSLITHSLSTAVIGPDGKIIKWYHGDDWQASDLLQDAAIFLRTPKRTANGSTSGHV